MTKLAFPPADGRSLEFQRSFLKPFQNPWQALDSLPIFLFRNLMIIFPYRQSEMWERAGVDLDCTTMGRWVMSCGELLMPLVDLMKQDIVASGSVITTALLEIAM